MLNRHEQTLINSIHGILTSPKNQFNNRNIYVPLNENRISYGDESQIVNLSYSQIFEPNDHQEDQWYNLDSSTCNQVMALEHPNEGLTIWESKQITPFAKQWDNNHGDFIRVQFTDKSLYITVLYSGQY